MALGCGGISLEVQGREPDAGHEHPHSGGNAGTPAPGIEAGAGQGGRNCSETFSEELVEHACSHTTLGPYVPVAALAPTTPEPTSVSVVQTAFRVDVVEPGARLAYRPVRDGAHVLFTDQPVSWTVRSENGGEILGRHLLVSGCSTIDTGYEVELESGATYVLDLGGGPPPRFTLFIEHEATFDHAAIDLDCE
jgi:hypothetical protein